MKIDFLQQIDNIIESYNLLCSITEMRDMSNISEYERQVVVSRAITAIKRISGSKSSYTEETDRILVNLPYIHNHIHQIIGVLGALREDVVSGHLQTITELARGEVFVDYLEMSQHLLDNNYKDAAAVIAGSTLETQLHALATKAGIPLVDTKTDGSITPRKADRLNSTLVDGGVYSKLEQKSITAWLDLRNKAAHGKYSEYSAEQVHLLIDGVRDFITRNPA